MLAAVPTRNVVSGALIEVALDVELARPVASVVVSLVFTRRSAARSRAALHLEILALRHRLAVLNRSPLATSSDRGGSGALGVAVAGVERLAAGARPRQAGHRAPLAPARVSSVLDVEASVPTGRPARAPEVCALIRRMAAANPLRGAPRIHGYISRQTVSTVSGIPRSLRSRGFCAQPHATRGALCSSGDTRRSFFTTPICRRRRGLRSSRRHA